MASMHSTICFLSLFLALHFFSSSLAKISSSPDAVYNSIPYPFFCQSMLPNNQSSIIYNYARFSIHHSLKTTSHFLSLVNSYLTLPNGLSQPTIRALKDCQSLLDSNMDFLSTTIQSIDSIDTLQSSQADDIHTLLSAIITNHQTCSDGLQATTPPSSIQNNFFSPFDNGNKLYSVSLALFKYGYVPKTRKGRWLTKRESMFSKNGHLGLKMSSQHRKVYESVSGIKLLQTSGGGQVKVNNMVIVNKDGSGNFTTISDAVAAAPNNIAANMGEFMIYVVGGVYEEYISIAKSKQYLMIVGDGINKTIITGNYSVADGWTTFSSATVGHRVYRMLFLNGLLEARFEKGAIRLTGCGHCHDGNTNPDMHVSVCKSGYQAYRHQYFGNQFYLRFNTIASDQADIPRALWVRGRRLIRSRDLTDRQAVFISLPSVTRRRSKRRSVSVQQLLDQWSTPPVNSQAEVSVSTARTNISVVQIDQHNMAGIEEIMRQLQESMQAMQQDAARQAEFSARQAEVMTQQVELIARLQQQQPPQQAGASASHQPPPPPIVPILGEAAYV
ncbi:hypothetical protein HYC85_010229 [Camellia sinensis]|uniref:Pectinesterase inhibitor domain-containing protein n=1 Tax=Camellia sinensis TaxID=4442 RepID=A0A7J7HIA3_CAMSI|nr:hypothetical protein HYC85_010229 [Camellia sinensis]